MTRIGRASPTGFASAPWVSWATSRSLSSMWAARRCPAFAPNRSSSSTWWSERSGDLNEALDRLATLGYESGGRGGVVASVAGLAAARCRAGSDIITCTSSSLVAGCTASALAFRDYLRTAPEQAQRYADLKMRAVRGIGDWEHYTKVKLEFVQRTLRAISAACASAQPLTAMDESRQRRRARGSSRPRSRNEAKGELSHGGKGMLLDEPASLDQRALTDPDRPLPRRVGGRLPGPHGLADWPGLPPAAASNRASGSPAHGSPTSFTGWHTQALVSPSRLGDRRRAG
jgi:hypothetical protein